MSAFSGFGGEVERRCQDYGESQSDVKLVSTFVPFIPATDVSRLSVINPTNVFERKIKEIKSFLFFD